MYAHQDQYGRSKAREGKLHRIDTTEKKASPQLKIGHYVLGDTLGIGTFGKVKGRFIFWKFYKNIFDELLHSTVHTLRCLVNIPVLIIFWGDRGVWVHFCMWL